MSFDPSPPHTSSNGKSPLMFARILLFFLGREASKGGGGAGLPQVTPPQVLGTPFRTHSIFADNQNNIWDGVSRSKLVPPKSFWRFHSRNDHFLFGSDKIWVSLPETPCPKGGGGVGRTPPPDGGGAVPPQAVLGLADGTHFFENCFSFRPQK